MKAAMGDRLIVEGGSDHESRKIGVITEVRHEDGTPPYLVRWADDDHESLVFPGPDAHVVSERSSDG
ncbi:DUF1918 domain-containing protein [Herbidospora galbida]|uniref:DUF1918 domain-containing protein n=1 Tax=Herbidospora galbida TaxID=2575442 RepID=A0A4U3MH46_9ACTN|nr:DUF1918 domain-containing protein [Herbidospora galbida]TKK87812.1 DUF1918 domain-containing protein [Herbidospora galbida]